MRRKMLAVLGQDDRMNYVASYLYRMGYELSQDYKEAAYCNIIILPPVLKNEDKTFLDTFNIKNAIIYYGKMSEEYKASLKKAKIQTFSYLEWESLIKENAWLTAKGIIKEAKLKKAVLKESHCLVTGYGFCAKSIANHLKLEGARVDIVVRRKELKKEIQDSGFDFVSLPNINEYNLQKYSYVFNTIPSCVLDATVLKRFSENILIFDIASSPGGTDFDFCKKNHMQAELYPALPGKHYSQEAGEVIAKAVLSHLEEHISYTS